MSSGILSALASSGGFLAAVTAVLWISRRWGTQGGVWGSFLLLGVLLTAGFLGASDPALLAVQSIVGVVAWGTAMRLAQRDGGWAFRLAKDRHEGDAVNRQREAEIAQLRERVSQRHEDIDRALKQYELIRRLSEAVSWSEMAPILDKAIKHFFRGEAWALHLMEESGQLASVHRRGAISDPEAARMHEKEPFLYTFLSTGGGQTTWALALPLWRLHESIGVLLIRLAELDSSRNSELLAEAKAFSVQLLFAMAKAKLFRELDLRSRTDGLTGLLRRAPFEERLKEEFARAKSFKTTFSLLMIDIDHFKRMNDTFGHQVGDEVLKTVSQRLKEGLYETDIIARYGEEFVCLMPRSLAAGLRQKAERIRQSIEQTPFVIGMETVIVTISLGIAHFPIDGATPHDVLEAADRALYAAKANGRNQVAEATPLPKAA